MSTALQTSAVNNPGPQSLRAVGSTYFAYLIILPCYTKKVLKCFLGKPFLLKSSLYNHSCSRTYTGVLIFLWIFLAVRIFVGHLCARSGPQMTYGLPL